MWRQFCRQQQLAEDTPYDQWKFCGGGPCADELAQLVLQGIKTATASAAIAYACEHVPIPQEGCYSVILFDNDEAACVIRTDRVSVVPFDQVSAEHAYKEGEGDRSLETWREIHRRVFAPDYLAAVLPFDEQGDCVLEEFTVVFR